jgi:ribosome-binding factor A
MESTRQQKVARLLQKELSNWFQRNAREFHPSCLITVTKITVSSDLALARVYLSFFNCDPKETLAKVNEKAKYIRGRVGVDIGKQMRVVPNFLFVLDDSLDYIENIERLLKK